MAVEGYTEWAGADQPAEASRPRRESACDDANRLLGKLESALRALDSMQMQRAPELLDKVAPAEPGLLDTLDRAHQLANQLNRRLDELAETIGRL